MNSFLDKTLCFTGHRPHKLNGYEMHENAKLLSHLKAVIVDHIENKGVSIFISGMALGIDMWAARMVMSLKREYPHIKLVAAVPCAEQWSKWKEESIAEWGKIVVDADAVYYVSEEPYTKWCMQKRNEWMVDRSQYVIAVWDGTSGGTKNCVDYGKKNCREIVQINPKEFA